MKVQNFLLVFKSCMLCLVKGSMFTNITKFREMPTEIQVFPTFQKFTLYHMAFLPEIYISVQAKILFRFVSEIKY